MLTLDQLDTFLNTAQSAGWIVSRPPEPRLAPVAVLNSRYGRIPVDYAFFLTHVTECVNAAQNVWFLTERDYQAIDVVENTFRWNEWELMSLAACDDDEDLTREVIDFWDRHLPIMSSVHSDYGYVAVRIDDGSLVYGFAPSFEEATPIGKSFPDYLAHLGDVIAGRVPLVDPQSNRYAVPLEYAYFV